MENKIRIVLAFDHLLFLEGLKYLLELNEDYQVIGMAQNGREIVKLCKTHRPDVLLLDVHLPGLNGIDITMRLRKSIPKMQIIGFSREPNRSLILRIFQAGAKGYLGKNSTPEELDLAIQSVLADKLYLSPSLSTAIIDEIIHKFQKGTEVISDPLTSREREVLQLISEGNNTKEISALLEISQKTVESHRKNIMDKLDLYNVADLVKYAIKNGIITLNFFIG